MPNVTDAEHSASQLSYEWTTSLFHNNHNHDEPVDNNASTSTQLSPVGCNGVTYWYRVTLKVSDPEGLSSTFTKDIYPNCSGSNQSINFSSIANKVTTDGPFNIAASASSGLPVALYVVDGPATINGNTVTLNGTPGYVTIRAVQGGNATYEPAVPVERTFQVIYIPPGSGGCTASGQISREVWTGISGTSVSDIPLSSPPDIEDQLTIFEIPVNVDDNYGTRVRGYICPPITGSYTFWISSDDGGELWLSTNDQESNKVLIAHVPTWSNSREWNKFPEQKSTLMTLVAGQRYYIEALQKEQGGGDNLAVGWQLPNSSFDRPISGTYLSPWDNGGAACFQENNGSLIIDVEHFHASAPGTGSAAGSDWQLISDGTASNGQALEATGSGVNTGDNTNGPRLDYNVNFSSSGTYYIWCRMIGPNSSDNSVHVGLNGTPATYGGTGLNAGSTSWAWENQVGGTVVSMNVPSAGNHTLNIWMREDGVKIDKLILSDNPSFTPSGLGGPESAACDGSDTTPPSVTISTPNDPVSGAFTVTATFSESVSGLSLSDFTVSNASRSNLSGSGAIYTFTLTPTSAGTVTAQLPANQASDAAGNGNEASNTLSVTYDPGPSCDNVTSGGSISGAESICDPYDPSTISSTAAASGGSGSLEYKWQSSTTSASGPWTDISASNASYNPPTINQSTWYRRLARRSGCTDYVGISNVILKEVQTNCGGTLPTGYCASRASAPWQEWIAQVNFGSIVHSSAKDGYADNTNLQTSIEQGGAYPITVDPGLSWPGHIVNLYWRIWIDFNRDGDFEDAGELVVQDQNTSATLTSNILVPANAAIGLARMRISMKKDAYAGPCELFGNGEVEDFAVNIIPSSGGSNCFINATSSNIQCNDNGTSADPADDTYTFDITVTGVNTGAGWIGGGTGGAYGQAVSFGPFPISGGSTSLTITDNDDAGCTDAITIAAPPSCSSGGVMPGGYCSSRGSAPWTEWIGRVTFRSIDHSSGKDRYADFTDQSTSAVQGANYPITLEPGLSWSGHIVDLYWRVWIDFNRDGDFEDAGELVVQDHAVSAPVNGSVQVPAGASIGATRMRVSMQKDVYPDPCENFEFGEVEDYKIILVSSGGQDVTPPDVTLSTPLTTVDGPFGISVTFTENVTGLTMSDFSITNGSGSGFNGSGSSYAFTVNPTSAGNVAIQLPANRAADAAGNGNTASNTLNVTYNPPAAPTVIITAPSEGEVITGTSIIVNYSTSGDLAGNNATHLLLTLDNQPTIDIHNMTGSYTLTNVAFGAHTLVAELADDSHVPLSNPEAMDVVNFSTQDVTSGPTATLSTASTNVNGPFSVSLNFSAPVTGLTLGDINVTNGSKSNGTGSGASYSFTITPQNEGTVTISVPADIAVDATGNGNQASNVLSVTYTNSGGPTSYCGSRASEPWHEWIGNVSFADLNHDSGKNGYGDFTANTANVVAGSSYPLSITPVYSYTHYDEYIRVWIDFNADGDFEDSGELVLEAIALAGSDGSPGNVVSDNISVPASAALGNTRMRVTMKRDAYADPCENFIQGEVEDYTVSISNSAAGSGNGFSSLGQEMLVFQAREAHRKVALEWLTNTEFKNDYFVVERSTNGVDFLPLREVNSFNGGYQIYRYEQVDDFPVLGANYYRLKQVFEDGEALYSPIEKVEFRLNLDEITVFPNPTTSELYVNLRKWLGRSALIQIYDAEGVLLVEKTVDSISEEALRMDVSQYVNGFYTLTIKAEGKPRFTSNFIINRLY